MHSLSNFWQSTSWVLIKTLSKTHLAMVIYALIVFGAICYLFYLLYLLNYWLLVNNYLEGLSCTGSVEYCRHDSAIGYCCLEILFLVGSGTLLIMVGILIFMVISDAVTDVKCAMENFDIEVGNIQNKRQT